MRPAAAEAFRLELVADGAPGAVDGDDGAGTAESVDAGHGAGVYALADSVAFEVIASYGNDFADTSLGFVDAGASWCVADGVSLGLFGEALLASQDPEDAWGGGGGALIRWHFLREARSSWFAEAGCGLLLTDGRLPGEGTEFNFTPRVSVGATLEIAAQARLIARVGWFHVSNAQTGQQNSGIDALAVGLGLTFGF